MSVLIELQKRLVPFAEAKRMFEEERGVGVREDWHAFLAFWAGVAHDAAEAFVHESKRRKSEFEIARAEAQRDYP